MKTGKILLKIAVVLIIALAMLIPSTFSWYDHNGEQTGNRMGYSRSELPVSAGVVGMATKRYNTEKEHNIKEGLDGGDSSKLYYDAKGNKEYGDAVTGETVTKGITHYYGTTFTNTSTAPAYVNLYLKNFTNSPTVKIGTLQPSLTDKGLSSSVHLTNKNMIRVYFQPKTANNWNDENANYYVVYKTKSSSTNAYRIFSKTEGNNALTDNNNETYYSGKIKNADDTGNILGGETTYYIDAQGNKQKHPNGSAKTEAEAQVFYDVNYQGTINLCKALENSGIPKKFTEIGLASKKSKTVPIIPKKANIKNDILKIL